MIHLCKEGMKRAGKHCSNNSSLSDHELEEAICGLELNIAFLEGRGDAALIIPKLATELNILKNWQRTRQKYDADMLAVSTNQTRG